MKNDPACRDALTLIRTTIEEHCPPGVLPSEEAVNCLYAPTIFGEAEAISRAIVATVERLTAENKKARPGEPERAHDGE
ncbi:hypothetical protein [Mesorhizobium sp. B1-1-7]|uniref:hypothetical protein n=1 Tax=Mesorhizobium sp. B1-1-7 TaxID=2589977 RepID=UPI00112B6FEA|nr:hypothetical protein [Mesorhizobium sp. B1-1-7]TPN43190.1 hypothetical protein FJ978_31295 [Mesorhizobium sp. B1-1-7]